jgi:hypothetical protein
MPSRFKTLALAAVVGTAALVPLFGDPRQTPLTHPLWARMLLRALDMTEAVRASALASQVFATLSWRDSLSYPAEHYLQAEGAVVRDGMVTAAAAPAEVSYPIAVVEPGDYQVRARLAGPPESPAIVEVLPLAGGRALKALTFVPEGARPAWVFGGSVHLDPGTYRAQFLLPPGCALAQIEVAPPCLNPIEPPGGWKPTAVTTTHDVAVTALKALDAEYELPPAEVPIKKTGADFQVEWPETLAVARAAASTELATMRLLGGGGGLRAIVAIDVPEPGLYSIEAFLSPGAGQRWLLDGCRKAIVCPGEGAGWRPLLAQVLGRGRHLLVVTLAEGASFDRIRVERKKDSASDYVAALRRLGFDAGPEGPVSRVTALAAARFVQEKRTRLLALACGDTVPRTPPAASPVPSLQAVVTPPAVPPLVQPPVPPLGPPIIPPQEPATPTLPSGGL